MNAGKVLLFDTLICERRHEDPRGAAACRPLWGYVHT